MFQLPPSQEPSLTPAGNVTILLEEFVLAVRQARVDKHGQHFGLGEASA